MSYEEILKAVFPSLDGVDLASCMLVCKQWRDVAQDDYFWKCLCAKRWPSICKRPIPPTGSYYKLYQKFHKRQHYQTLLPPRISFDDLEFFIDIWSENKLIFSKLVPGPVLHTGIQALPSLARVRSQDEAPEYKMILPVEPRFKIPLSQTVSFSVFVERKDSGKVACIIDKSMFDYIDRTGYKAMAFDYLHFSPEHPFIPGIRAWISLLFVEERNEGIIDVFGIEMDFCDAAKSKDEVLWLLDILDWK
ncbi:hypothetical protein Tsubulata_004077 [Turnera subulata]|uniref:F-box domain-containing protein n=1 Tax=Turnera subulata TaxID=218843 RepID=A0A9Q0F7L0_9ROSI|nr:hypothetical protein Tsubulata_004077 [Turnera subulata]